MVVAKRRFVFSLHVTSFHLILLIRFDQTPDPDSIRFDSISIRFRFDANKKMEHILISASQLHSFLLFLLISNQSHTYLSLPLTVLYYFPHLINSHNAMAATVAGAVAVAVAMPLPLQEQQHQQDKQDSYIYGVRGVSQSHTDVM